MSLRDKLVAYRKRVADGKPAFCVFDNKMIDAIVDAKPRPSRPAASPARPDEREKYGEDVARICTEHGGGVAGAARPSKPRKRRPTQQRGGALEGFRRAARRPRSSPARARAAEKDLTADQVHAAEVAIEGRSVLTGGAGTGKSFLLRYIISELRKSIRRRKSL